MKTKHTKRIFPLAMLLGFLIPLQAQNSGICPEQLQELYQQGDYQQGIQLIQTSQCQTTCCQRYMGLFYHQSYNSDSVILHLSKVYQQDTQDEWTALALAEAYVWKKRFKDAQAILKALKNKTSSSYYRIQSTIFSGQGQFPQAINAMDNAIGVDGGNWQLYLMKAKLHSWNKEFSKARKQYDFLIKKSDINKNFRTSAKVGIAELLAWENKFKQSEKILRNILKTDPAHAEATLLLGQVMEWQEQYLQAKTLYSNFLTHYGNHPQIHQRLSALLWVND
jgi:tetratricopeptide (TPR) repeat protein